MLLNCLYVYGENMAYSEFPHAHYLEYDEHQIIFLVKKLENEYAEILDKARKAEADASAAVSKVDNYSTNVSSLIEQKVNSAVIQANALLNNDVSNLNNKFNALQGEFNVLRSDVTRETKAARDYVDTVSNKLEHDVGVQIAASNGYTASLVNQLRTESTQLITHVNQQIRESKEHTEKVANEIKAANKKDIDEFRKEFDQHIKEAEERNADIREEVRKQLARLTKAVEEKITSLDALTATRMKELSEQIVLAMNIVEKKAYAYTGVEVADRISDVQLVVEETIDDIKETVAEIKNSQVYNNVGWLWNNFCSIGGFSAIEIYEYGDFNVDMWNASEITCKEWFTSGKQKLGYNTGRMFDTMSGRFLEIGSVVHELVRNLNAQGIIRNGFGALSIKKKRRKK